MNRRAFLVAAAGLGVVASVHAKTEETPVPRFRPGDRVANTSLGPQVTGTVVACVAADYWLGTMPSPCMSSWDNAYPGWLQGVVYYVRLDTPSRGVRPDECPSAAEYEALPLQHVFTYPEDELVFLEKFR